MVPELATYTVGLRVEFRLGVSWGRGADDAATRADVSTGDQLPFEDASDA
jgi:hypothetical protein